MGKRAKSVVTCGIVDGVVFEISEIRICVAAIVESICGGAIRSVSICHRCPIAIERFANIIIIVIICCSVCDMCGGRRRRRIIARCLCIEYIGRIEVGHEVGVGREFITIF